MKRDQLLQVRLTRQELSHLEDLREGSSISLAISVRMSDFIRSKLGLSGFIKVFPAGAAK